MKRFLLTVALAAFACSADTPPEKTATATAPAPAPVPMQQAPPSFVNHVWRVAAGSDLPSGPLYVFLSDHTLLIASATGRPALGRWEEAAHGIVMVEESQSYPTDIVESSPQRLVLRQHNPGGTLTLVMERAGVESRTAAGAPPGPKP